MSDSYFVIGCGPDGLRFNGPLSQGELEKRLMDGYYSEDIQPSFRNSVPQCDGFCLMMGENELLIIRGSIVQPKPVETITRWKVT